MTDPRCCTSLHAAEVDLRRCIEDEKNRGYWKNATVDEAITSTLLARRSGLCVCSCHQQIDGRRGSGIW